MAAVTVRSSTPWLARPALMPPCCDSAPTYLRFKCLTPSPAYFKVPLTRPTFLRHSDVSRRTSFFVRAMEVSGPGSIESTLMQSMTRKLKDQLNTNDVVVKDAYGDGRHVSIEVVSADFEGKTSVNRQRMVYKVIWEELQATVHAVDNMQTWTPEEAAKERL